MLKKTILILVVICLLFTMQLSVFADEGLTIDQSSSGGSSSITVQTKAVNQPEFTISIPESIAPESPIDRTAGHQNHDIQFEVAVSNLQYLNGKQIRVMLSAPNDSFTLRCDGHELPFRVYKNAGSNAMTEIPETGGEFATFTQDGTAVGIVRIDSYDIRHAGQYGGSIIFTVQAVETE